jgi:hypothetical protein
VVWINSWGASQRLEEKIMAGFAGAVVGLTAGNQPSIAPTQSLTDGTTSSRGCTTNFIGFGFGLTNEEENPNDFSATEDIVVRSLAANGTVETPGYTAVSGTSPARSTLAWTAGATAVIPANTVAPTITGTAQVGQTLTAGNGTWTGTPTPTYTYNWLVGGVQQSTASTYVPVTADIGKTIVLRVIGSNAKGSVTANSSATAAVIAA